VETLSSQKKAPQTPSDLPQSGQTELVSSQKKALQTPALPQANIPKKILAIPFPNVSALKGPLEKKLIISDEAPPSLGQRNSIESLPNMKSASQKRLSMTLSRTVPILNTPPANLPPAEKTSSVQNVLLPSVSSQNKLVPNFVPKNLSENKSIVLSKNPKSKILSFQNNPSRMTLGGLPKNMGKAPLREIVPGPPQGQNNPPAQPGGLEEGASSSQNEPAVLSPHVPSLDRNVMVPNKIAPSVSSNSPSSLSTDKNSSVQNKHPPPLPSLALQSIPMLPSKDFYSQPVPNYPPKRIVTQAMPLLPSRESSILKVKNLSFQPKVLPNFISKAPTPKVNCDK
jgi:hypothetical protein